MKHSVAYGLARRLCVDRQLFATGQMAIGWIIAMYNPEQT